MSSNAALQELESKADLGVAKRDLVLRFVRDQESLQTSQVELKLVNDETIDLIDSAFSSNTDSKEKLSDKTTENSITTGVAGLNLDEGRQVSLAPRPPSGRPHSRRLQRRTSHDPQSKPEQFFCYGRMRSTNDMGRLTRPMSPAPVCLDTHHSSSPRTSNPLNSSWPQQQFVSRKCSSGSSRKYALLSPENTLTLETCGTGVDGARPLSTQSIGRITTSDVLAARVRKHSASNRLSCNLGQITVDSSHNSRSSSPAKAFASRQGAKSRGRAFINLNLEPVHPSELPLLRTASAPSTGPYTLVQLPPIQSREAVTATPPPS